MSDGLGLSQLHLLMFSFSPMQAYTKGFIALLTSALAPSSGLRCDALDEQGRHCLFPLCQAMAATPAKACPQAQQIMSLVLEACTKAQDESNDNNNNNNGKGKSKGKKKDLSWIGASDRTGCTLLDIAQGNGNEKVTSCLSLCKAMVRR